MNLDVDQLRSRTRERLMQGIYAARRVPGWLWAIPAALTVGFLWAVALCWQPASKDQPSVTVKSVERKPAVAIVNVDPTPAGDYVPQTARSSRRRSRKRHKETPRRTVRLVTQEEPEATAITPEAHWKETIVAPKEVGALKHHSEPAESGGGDGGAQTE